MNMANYTLSGRKEEGDELSYNIISNRKKIYYNIINFYNQKENNGIFAENILRLALNGVNLNHLSKNHPHVDIAIINGIEGITQEDEVISVKSSIQKNFTLAKVISDTKAIKLESMLSYVVFANSSFQVDYKKQFVNAKAILKEAIEIVKESDNPDYLAAVNVSLFYILTTDYDFRGEFRADMATVAESTPGVVYQLSKGSYNRYKSVVKKKIDLLQIPISLGCIYMQGVSVTDKNSVTCIIKKTNAIPLGTYWERLVEIWNRKGYFGATATKYLTLTEVKNLFGITTNDFPIEIKISTGTYKPSSVDYSKLSDEDKVSLGREKAKKRTKELYVATKFKDADFGKQSDEVNDFFLDAITKLQKNPNLVTSFSQFSKTLVV